MAKKKKKRIIKIYGINMRSTCKKKKVASKPGVT